MCFLSEVDCKSQHADPTSAEKRFVDLIKAELGVDIHPQAWRIFLRHNKKLAACYFHRIVE